MTLDGQENISSYIRSYCKLIEERKDWGPIDEWRYSQFRVLAEELKAITGVSVSYMTLTRILQKKEFKRSPQLATLNALANYFDFDDWDSFCQAFPAEPLTSEKQSTSENQATPIKTGNGLSPMLVGFTSIAILLLVVVYLVQRPQKPSVSKKDEVVLSVLNEDPQVPEMLSFRYKVPGDGFYFWIRPSSWKPDSIYNLAIPDKGLKALNAEDSTLLLNIDGTIRPGPYDGLIVKDGQIFARVAVNMGSKDWVNLVYVRSRQKKPKMRFRPIFTAPVKNEEGLLLVSPQIQEDIRNNYIEKTYEINYFLARDFSIDANNLQFETRLKNTFPDEIVNCKYLRVTLLTTNGMLEIPLVQKGCKSLLRLWVSEYQGSYKDRTMDQYEKEVLGWEHIAIQTENNIASIYLNDQLIDQIAYHVPLGELKGIRFKFDGNGAIDFVQLSKPNGEIIYEDHFEKTANQLGAVLN